jgi:phosphoglycolate phosphatase
MMIDGLVFDKDGTLFDFRLSWGRWTKEFLLKTARNSDHAAEMALRIRYDLESATFAPESPVIAGTPADIAAALLPVMPGFSASELSEMIDGSAQGAVMTPAVPLLPLLTQLRARGLALGVATNDAEQAARVHLEAHGLTDMFDFIAGYDTGFGAKPGPGMCLAFARSTGLLPARVAMVGDSLHDLAAGRAAGMRTVAVLTGVARAAELAPLADAVLPDIGALPAWLDALTA